MDRLLLKASVPTRPFRAHSIGLMALASLAGRLSVPRTFAKPLERELTVLRIPPVTCRRPATAPLCVHSSAPSSNNGKVPDTFGRDEEDSLSPLGLIAPPLRPVRNSAVKDTAGADRADAAPVLAEIAREKFWGRVAVLALGVSLSKPSIFC